MIAKTIIKYRKPRGIKAQTIIEINPRYIQCEQLILSDAILEKTIRYIQNNPSKF